MKFNLPHPLNKVWPEAQPVAISLLTKVMQDALHQADDSLFKMSVEKIEMFEAMRTLRLQKSILEKTIIENISLLWSLEENKSEEVGAENIFKLHLVENEDLEKTLAVTEVVAKMSQKFNKEIWVWEELISKFDGLNEKVVNCLSPTHMLTCFKDPLDSLDISISSRLVIYKCLEKSMLSRISELYQSVFMICQNNGMVIPSGSLVVAKSCQRKTNLEGFYNESTRVADIETWESIKSLMLSKDKNQWIGDGGDSSIRFREEFLGIPISKEELLASLLTVQKEFYRFNQHLDAASSESPNQITEKIYQQIKQKDSNLKITAEQESVLEAITMMFNYVLEDETVDAAIRTLLSKLQIPYLKAALIDGSLFFKEDHPARMLLNDLSESGKGYYVELNKGQEILKEIKSVVKNVFEQVDHNDAVFAEQLAAFSFWIEGFNKKNSFGEKRTSEAALGHDKVEYIRKKIEKIIAVKLVNLSEEEVDLEINPIQFWIEKWLIPEWTKESLKNWKINDFKEDYEVSWPENWSPYLFDNLTLIQSTPKTFDEKINYVKSSKVFEEEFKNWFDRNSVPAKDSAGWISSFKDFLRRFQGSNKLVTSTVGVSKGIDKDVGLGGKSINSEKDSKKEGAIGVVSINLPVVSEKKSPYQIPLKDLLSARHNKYLEGVDKNILASVRGLKKDQWFSLKNKTGDFEKGKLVLITPLTSRYLIVNQSGLKMCEPTAEELAINIQRGDVKVVTGAKFFDRAMSFIQLSLSKS